MNNAISLTVKVGGLLKLHIKTQHIQVACAVIEHGGQVLAVQRSATMSLPLKSEFPGGKIDEGESPEECLKREVHEELGIEASVGQPLTALTHTYPTFTVTLYPFLCKIVAGEISLHEHNALVWLPGEELHKLDWAEADWPVIEEYQRQFAEITQKVIME